MDAKLLPSRQQPGRGEQQVPWQQSVLATLSNTVKLYPAAVWTCWLTPGQCELALAPGWLEIIGISQWCGARWWAQGGKGWPCVILRYGTWTVRATSRSESSFKIMELPKYWLDKGGHPIFRRLITEKGAAGQVQVSLYPDYIDIQKLINKHNFIRKLSGGHYRKHYN